MHECPILSVSYMAVSVAISWLASICVMLFFDKRLWRQRDTVRGGRPRGHSTGVRCTTRATLSSSYESGDQPPAANNHQHATHRVERLLRLLTSVGNALSSVFGSQSVLTLGGKLDAKERMLADKSRFASCRNVTRALSASKSAATSTLATLPLVAAVRLLPPRIELTRATEVTAVVSA